MVTWNNEEVKKYYRDCGKGLKKGDARIYWGLVRGFPSLLYQTRRREDTLEEIIKLKIRGKILDAACGSGYILKFLPPGSVGLEINPRHVLAAKKNAPKAKVILGDIEKIPFPDGALSAVLALEIFEHLPDSSSTISEIWRVLRKNGYLVVSVPCENFLWKLRFLASSMYATEPQCLTFSKEFLLALFNKYKYKVKRFKRIAYRLNHLLILQKL